MKMVGTSSEMYRLKPLVKIEDPVSSSTSMYTMKRLFTFGAPATTDSAPVECVLPSAQELAEEDLLLKDLKDEEVKALKGLRCVRGSFLGRGRLRKRREKRTRRRRRRRRRQRCY